MAMIAVVAVGVLGEVFEGKPTTLEAVEAISGSLVSAHKLGEASGSGR